MSIPRMAACFMPRKGMLIVVRIPRVQTPSLVARAYDGCKAWMVDFN